MHREKSNNICSNRVFLFFDGIYSDLFFFLRLKTVFWWVKFLIASMVVCVDWFNPNLNGHCQILLRVHTRLNQFRRWQHHISMLLNPHYYFCTAHFCMAAFDVSHDKRDTMDTVDKVGWTNSVRGDNNKFAAVDNSNRRRSRKERRHSSANERTNRKLQTIYWLIW